MKALNKTDLVVFRPQGSGVTVEVKLKDETVWLTQSQLANLFDAERSVVTKHLRNIFKDKELQENSVCAKFAHTAADGKPNF